MKKDDARLLQTQIESLQSLMAAYVTDGRTEEQPAEYKTLWRTVHLKLERVGYADPNPHSSLEAFWGFCKLKGLDTYAKRRVYINDLYSDVLLDLERHAQGEEDPAYWQQANDALQDGLAPIRTQWLKAKNYIYTSPPDLENSIKESINSVESALKILLGEPTLTLGKLIKKADLDPDIASVISKVYGLLSNKDFVRHGGVEEQRLEPSDAKFFLSFAAAAIIYLKERITP